MKKYLCLVVFCVFVVSVSEPASAANLSAPFGNGVKKSLVKVGSSWLQKLTGVAAAAIIICSPLLVGCEQGRGLFDVVETEFVDEQDELAGQYVDFYIDDILYKGYWEVTPDGLFLAEVNDGDGKLVFVEYAVGEIVPDHVDIGAEVVMLGERNGFFVERNGIIVEAYDNGFRLIEIHSATYLGEDHIYSGRTINFSTPQLVLAHDRVLFENGGFELVETEYE